MSPMRRGCIYRKLLTDLRRLSDEIPTDVKQSVGIPSEWSNLKRLYNGHIFVGNGHMVRRNSVGKYRRNSDDFAVNLKWPTEFRRPNFFGFGRKFVSIPSEMSDDICVRRNLRRNSVCFLVVLSAEY
ncbi:hypothetical protein F2Q69_00026645 [Brassica cretica]|uniref:Uncharacterized protein n=1 Tax=Brassica cretica TaxID=69181 RepID=A0A8S9S624_BRACR|nr:hypothetical protein F2Q69_00026645 [Brassica cretica]